MTSAPPPIEWIIEAEKYMQRAREYYDNSQPLLTQNELTKAGELLWGAIFEAVKGFHMMTKGGMVKTHRAADRQRAEKRAYNGSGAIAYEFL